MAITWLKDEWLKGTEAEMWAYVPADEGVFFWTKDTKKSFKYEGEWIALGGSGTGGMEIHGNEYHNPDMEPANANIQAHVTGTGSPHTAAGIGAEPANANIQAHITSAHAPANAQKNSDILKAEIEAKLTGEITTHTHPGGGGLTLSQVYPVGSVYISVVATNPGLLFGMGTWAKIGAGRVLVGQDTGDTSFDVLEETGGAKSHNHTYTQVPNHVHVQKLPSSQTGTQASGTRDTSTTGSVNDALSTNNPTGGVAQGTTDLGSNLMPYFVVNIWKRTA